MRALVLAGAHPELAGADAAAPAFLQHYAHPVLAGLVFGLIGAYVSRGQHAEAREEVQEILRVNPKLTADLAAGIPALRMILGSTKRAQLRDQLRSAGLP